MLAEYAANAAAATPQKEYGYRGGQLLITATCPAPAAKLAVSAATASGYYATGNEPTKAIDGNPTTTLWNAGTFAPAWIQVDLGQTYSLSQVRLLTAQSPDGHTTHEIYGGPSPTSLTLLGTVDGNTTSSQWLQLNTAATNVRYVKVLTTASPSWIAWFEVEVYQAAQPADLEWLVTDQLGTPRIIFDKTGSLAGTKRHDYLPFGEEIGGAQVALLGGRTTGQGYTSDSTRQHFTGYELDAETGLNFAQARYQSSVQGRFTSVDPLGASANTGDPQSFNRYSYVGNNPTNLTDPTGMMLAGPSTKENPHVGHGFAEANEQLDCKSLVLKGYRRVDNGDSFSYEWVNDKAVHDVPNDYSYKDTDGDTIQLSGNDETNEHHYTTNKDGASPPNSGAPNSEYVSTTYGLWNFGMGHIVDSNAKVYFTFQIAPSWPSYSYSKTTGKGPVSPGVYGQGTVGSLGLVINESVNLRHPLSGISRETGFGTPQGSVGIQIIMPACEGTTAHDWAFHPDNPKREGLMWHPVGRSPF
ncbi:MAG TPA: RHS repeat-associated core domain-containing protein [Pyrinomonadaceae bacterium]|nr:RHS repeat-associated core domain-containing protein [Pyrinomonadaceae bacterium]